MLRVFGCSESRFEQFWDWLVRDPMSATSKTSAGVLFTGICYSDKCSIPQNTPYGQWNVHLFSIRLVQTGQRDMGTRPKLSSPRECGQTGLACLYRRGAKDAADLGSEAATNFIFIGGYPRAAAKRPGVAVIEHYSGFARATLSLTRARGHQTFEAAARSGCAPIELPQCGSCSLCPDKFRIA